MREAAARTDCGASPMGIVCSSYIPIDRLAKIYAAQQASEWCWAASISMIFGYYGHRVAQARIVSDAYGSVANMPGNFPALVGSLERSWTDDSGNDFDVSINGIFLPEMGMAALNNLELIGNLDNEDPILFCTATHAMVLTAMNYRQTPMGPDVYQAFVMDPWPGMGLRQLGRAELVPMYRGGAVRMVATVQVS